MKSWYRIENRADGPAMVFLYDEIGGWGVSAGDFVKEIRDLSGPIDLHINSPGGSVFDGMAIYNAIRNHPGDVNVIVDGLAASAASFVAMAGDTIVAERNATLMIHDGIGVAVGNAKDMLELASLLDKCSENIAAIYADRAGGSMKEWREKMRAETWYSAQEAKDAGLIDEIRPGKGRGVPTNKWDLSLFQFRSRQTQGGVVDPVLAAELDPPEMFVALRPQPAADPPDEAGFLMPDIRGPIEALAEIPWDADLFRAAVAVVANDSPAPDSPPPSVPDSPEPEFSINLPDLRRAMKEARL